VGLNPSTGPKTKNLYKSWLIQKERGPKTYRQEVLNPQGKKSENALCAAFSFHPATDEEPDFFSAGEESLFGSEGNILGGGLGRGDTQMQETKFFDTNAARQKSLRPRKPNVLGRQEPTDTVRRTKPVPPFEGIKESTSGTQPCSH